MFVLCVFTKDFAGTMMQCIDEMATPDHLVRLSDSKGDLFNEFLALPIASAVDEMKEHCRLSDLKHAKAQTSE